MSHIICRHDNDQVKDNCIFAHEILTHWSLGDAVIIEVMFKPISIVDILSTACEIILRWIA